MPIKAQTPSEVWNKALPDVFLIGSYASAGSYQSLRAAVDLVVTWATDPIARPPAITNNAVAA